MILSFGQMIRRAVFLGVDWLDLCVWDDITLHPNKFQFGQETVTFAGFEILMGHVKPCQKFIEAFANFPTPDIHNINYGLV